MTNSDTENLSGMAYRARQTAAAARASDDAQESPDAGSPAGPAPASLRDEGSPNARGSAAVPPLPASWRVAASSGYPPDEDLWYGQSADAKPHRRVGRTIAVVSLVAAVIAAAVVANNDGRLRSAVDEVATRVQTALAAALAKGDAPSTAPVASPPEFRAPVANHDSEPKLAASEEPTATRAAAPVVLPAPEAAEPTPPPRADQATEPGSALVPAHIVPPKTPARPRPAFVFARSTVTVPESRSAVALTIRRSGSAAGTASVVWWCRDGTARANKDFADLGRRTETFAAAETSRTIFVPIINDGKAEVNKHFSVHLGEYDRERRHLQVLSTVHVEIDDDD